jgi:hypothetical protein
VSVPSCQLIEGLARQALAERGRLVAYSRPEPIVARGDQTLWPGRWYHDAAAHTLTPTVPGQAISHIALASSQTYELWLGGSFTRGFELSVDGRYVGHVKDELAAINGYAHVADMRLAAGVHTVAITYPRPDLTPGSAEGDLTSLSEITFEPSEAPSTSLLTAPPTRARALCGLPLDWIEIVTSA